jgi:hypothetical protein
VTSKKQGASAVARQPKDAVPGEEAVRLPQYLINGIEFSAIDFGARLQSCHGLAEGN